MFLGQRNDTNKLYQAMDIFVLPSLYEGLPVVGVEAQASGLLCILSSEMTKETKILEGTEFESINKPVQEWAEIIIDNFSEYIRKNQEDIITKSGFSIEEEGKKLEEEYIMLLGKIN